MSNYAQAQYIIDEVLGGIPSSSSGGITPDKCTGLITKATDNGILLMWKDPKDTYVNSQLICTWAKTIIVRKNGEYPTSLTDGDIVVENTVRNQYSTGYEDTNFTETDDPSTFYYKAFPVSDTGSISNNDANCFKSYILYGFKINKADSNPATRVTYLEMAEGMTPAKMNYETGQFDYGSWNPDEIFFMQNNYPAMVLYDGSEDYKLNPNDYSLKLDGTSSDVANIDYAGNAMTRMDIVWLKQYEDDTNEYCYISNIQLDEDFHAFAHQRADGTYMDYIWLSCFEGTLSSSKIRSISGLTTMNTQTGTNEITYAQANGDLWYTRSWSQRNLINMLLILIGCSDDSQTTFGNGHYTGGSQASHLLKTGTLINKGRFYGSNGTGVGVKVFHLENWWGNAWERIAGLMYVSGTIRTKMVAPYNTTGSEYNNTGVSMGGTSGGYCSVTQMTNQGRLPVTMSGSQTTYTCDGGWYNASQVDYAIVGGGCYSGFLCGASAVPLNNLVSHSDWSIGAALSCEQPLAA